MAGWQVYIILCSDGTLYTGCSTDAGRRFILHAGGRGAKYFRGRRPLRLVYVESGHTRSTAGTEEVRIKNLKRAGKLRLIASAVNEIPEKERGAFDSPHSKFGCT